MSEVDWEQAIYVYFDKPERLKALWHLRNKIPPSTLKELFTAVWMQLESHYQEQELILQFFDFFQDDPKTWMMNEEDQKAFRRRSRISKEWTIYRGCWEGNKDGYSWTTSYPVAVKFAQRHAPDGQPLVVKARVAAKDITAYLLGRGENEVVLLPTAPRNIFQFVRLPKQVPTTNSLLFQAIQAGNFWSEEQEIEKMVMTGTLQPTNYIEKWLEPQIAFFKEHGFEKKLQLFESVREKIIALKTAA